MTPETIAVIVPTALMGPSGGTPYVVSCLESLLPAIEAPDGAGRVGRQRVREVILVTQGRALESPVVERIVAAGVHVRQMDVEGPFNFSRKVNIGAAVTTADVLFLLNDDAQLRGPSWPEVFLGILTDPGIGAVGPVILNPDGSLNAAGDALLSNGARHIDEFDLRNRPGLAKILTADHDVTLLTAAALAIRRAAFLEIGGFDDAYPGSFGDADFCLRLGAAGHRLVCTPRVTVVHKESSSRDPTVSAATAEHFRRMHRKDFRDDPLLPPLVLHVRLRRSAVSSVRSSYRRTLKRFLPAQVRDRIRHAAKACGWFK